MVRMASFSPIILIPAIIVAGIITIITSLYISANNEAMKLADENVLLNEKLQIKDKQLKENEIKIQEFERAGLIAEQTSKQSTINKIDQPQVQNNSVPLPELQSPTKINTVNTKIASIAKFIPLDDSQRQRLKDKFTAELNDGSTETEKLEDIIGKENADFYREQRKTAFERVIQESIEKEIYYISRKLSLDSAQEEAFRKVYLEIENEVRDKRGAMNETQSQASTLEKLVLEEKERNRLLAEKMKNILNPAQYQEFIKYESGNQDMQLWHEQ